MSGTADTKRLSGGEPFVIYMAGGNAYALAHEHKNGWNPEAFRERFSEVLERYDYIVGDWGYNQLRLRGFYRNQQPKAPKDAVISSLAEYINEYCNFGCAYFVLEKTDLRSVPEGTRIVTEEEPAVKADAVGAADEGDSAAEEEANPQVSMAAAIAAAMAASPTGMLLRWPLKERPGGRVPGTSPSAVARAVSEGAERRAAAAAAQAGAGAARADSSPGRPAYEAGAVQGGGRARGGDAGAQGRDRRPHHGGGGGSRSGGRQDRGPGGGGGAPRGSAPYPARDGGGERQSRQAPPSGGAGRAAGSSPTPQGGDDGNAPRGGGAGGAGAGGGRWAGKNRRRGGAGGFHSGKPNRPRPEGAQRFDGGRRPDAGGSGGERS